jgi:acetoacetate decarboxylase
LIARERARELIPAQLPVISVAPGKTLGALWIAAYERGSTLEYRELIVGCGLTRHGTHLGLWISHIFVDEPRSLAAGREVWGLPKELASFTGRLAGGGELAVHRGTQLLCEARWQVPRWHLPAPLYVPALTRVKEVLCAFAGRGATRLAACAGQLEVPDSSPLRGLVPEGRATLYHHSAANLIVQAPRPLERAPTLWP